MSTEEIKSSEVTMVDRFKITTRVTIVGAVVNCILAVLKIVIGTIGFLTNMAFNKIERKIFHWR